MHLAEREPLMPAPELREPMGTVDRWVSPVAEARAEASAEVEAAAYRLWGAAAVDPAV
jgi:hypothetical protein